MPESDVKPKFDITKFMKYGQRKKRKTKNPYPRFNRRMLAGTVDSILLLTMLPIIDAVAPVHQDALNTLHADPADPHALKSVLYQIVTNSEFMISWLLNLDMQMLIFCIYSILCWKKWSSTPGKLLLRMKIVDEKTGDNMSNRQIIIRALGYWVSTYIFMLGFCWISIDKRHRAWHDLMAGTVVIDIPWKKKNIITSPTAELPTIPPEDTQPA